MEENTETINPDGNEEQAVEVLGLLPPHEQMFDLATYGPVLIAKEECERNYAGEVVVIEDKEVDTQVVELLWLLSYFFIYNTCFFRRECLIMSYRL